MVVDAVMVKGLVRFVSKLGEPRFVVFLASLAALGCDGASGPPRGAAPEGGTASKQVCPKADLRTDPNNCGACFNVCEPTKGLGGTGARVVAVPRSGGNATMLAAIGFMGFGSPAIAAGNGHVYWEEYGVPEMSGAVGGYIRSVPMAGGDVITPVAPVQGLNLVKQLAIAGDNILWTNAAGDLMESSVDGGGLSTLWAGGSDRAVALTADATNVYFLTESGKVLKLALDGVVPVTLASNFFGNLKSIAVDSSNVYWADSWDAVVMSVGLGGGTPSVVFDGHSSLGDAGAEDPDTPLKVAASSSNLVWASTSTARGASIGVRHPGSTVSSLATGLAGVTSLAVDDENAYFTDSGAGKVYALSLAGGEPRELAAVPSASGVAVVDGVVYVTGDNESSTSFEQHPGTCVSGACQNCGPGAVWCFGDCVDPQSDSWNCGKCGNVCAIGTTCRSGACALE